MAETRAWEQRYAELEAKVADACVSMKQMADLNRSRDDKLWDDRPDPKPIYEIKADKEIPKASSKSKRRYKLQKRISCEELDERTMKGLCLFCEEPETPGHYLQHMNSCLLMIDSEDHLSDPIVNKIGNEISSDRWLSNSISCESEIDETDNDEDRVDSYLVVNDIEKESRLEVVTDKKESMEVDTPEVEHKTESGGRAEEPPKSVADEVHVQPIELVVRDQAQEARSDVVSSPGISVKRDGAVETQTCISGLANHVWKPGEFVHPKIQLDWLERADSNQEKESNKKLRKLHINHCFAVQEFSGIHGSISGPWHLAFDPGGIISYTACDDFVVTHTQWVGHDRFEGCSNVQTLAIDVDVKKGKNSFLRDVKIILDLAVKEYRMGKAEERLLPGHYRLLHTFDQCGGLNATVIAGTIMQSSLKSFHQLRVACLHHTSLGFLYGSLPRPPEKNHSNFSHMLQYHETWSCISLRANRVWDPGGKISLHPKLPVNSQGSKSTLQRKTEVCPEVCFYVNLEVKVFQRREICYRIWASQAHYLLVTHEEEE